MGIMNYLASEMDIGAPGGSEELGHGLRATCPQAQ